MAAMENERCKPPMPPRPISKPVLHSNVLMDSKNKRKRLTFSDKRVILEKLSSGSTKEEILTEYGISKSCLNRVINKKTEIIDCTSLAECEWKNKKSKISSSNKKLEDALYMWFTQKRSMGKRVTGPMLCEKAIIFNDKLDGPSSFKGSHGWLDKFKNRHGIKQLGVKEDKLSKDDEIVKEFQIYVKNYIRKKSFHIDNVYNAAETGMHWKSLPSKSLSPPEESTLSQKIDSHDRVTILVCANATGTHRIPLFIVGKYQQSRCLETNKCLPVLYKTKKDAWMDRALFLDWYENNFIPLVLNRQEKSGIRGNVLLILNNAPPHPPIDIINSININFEVLYLPPNVTTVLQPMNQGIIATTKKLYKKTFLRKLLLQKNMNNLEDAAKYTSFRDCSEIISFVWTNIKDSLLSKAWEALLEDDVDSAVVDNDADDTFNNDRVCDFIESISENTLVNVINRDVISWLNNDDGDQGWDPLSDDDIVNIVNNEENAVDPLKLDNFQYEIKKENEGNTRVTARDAYESLKTIYDWFQEQVECTPADLLILNKIRDLAAKKELQVL